MVETTTMARNAGIPASSSSPNKTTTIRAMENASTGLSSTPAAIIDHCAQVGRLLMPDVRVADLAAVLRPGWLQNRNQAIANSLEKCQSRRPNCNASGGESRARAVAELSGSRDCSRGDIRLRLARVSEWVRMRFAPRQPALQSPKFCPVGPQWRWRRWNPGRYGDSISSTQGAFHESHSPSIHATTPVVSYEAGLACGERFRLRNDPS